MRYVSSSALPPVYVWIRGFTLCGNEICLFDVQALNCPVPVDPAGGRWLAGGEIAFAGTDQHGGVNIAEIGGQEVAMLIGYRVPDPGWCEWLQDCLPNASPTQHS